MEISAFAWVRQVNEYKISTYIAQSENVSPNIDNSIIH